MEVVSLSALPVASRVWQPRPGSYVLTFVCKATFTLAPGELALAPEQEPVREADCPWSAAVTSLYAASDLVPGKPRADVILVGNAYAPEGAAAAHLVARLAVAEVDKSIEVWADRHLEPSGAVVEGPPFSHVPLLYERAAGGPGTSNPVGISPDDRDAYGAVALPNLLAPGARVGPGEARLQPVGFGPIAATWPLRASRLGRLAQTFSVDRWDVEPLPGGFDMAYFNVAPPDQQPAALQGNERIVLENLHQEHPRLVMTLPGLRLAAQVEGPGGSRALALTCDTLWIDTSRGVCTLTYRGRVNLSSPAEQGWLAVSLESRDAARPQRNLDEPTAADIAISRVPDEATQVGQKATAVFPQSGGSALPFRPGPPPAREPSASRPDGAFPSALPFRPAGLGAPPPPRPPPPPLPHRSGMTVPAELRRGAPPVPPPVAPPGSTQAITVMPSSLPAAASSAVMPAPVVPPPIVPPPVVPESPRPIDSPWANPSVVGAGTIAPVPAAAAASAPVAGDFRNGGSALLASNAAAGVVAGAYAQEAPRPAAPLVVPSRPVPREAAELVDLVFFDPDSLPRIRRVPAWKKILSDLDDRPLDAEDDDPAAAKDPAQVEDRREIAELLVRADISTLSDLDAAVSRAARDDGRFFAPLVIVAGELSTPFDEVETLRATVTAVAPLIAGDENLRGQIDVAQAFLQLPGPLGASPAEGLTRRLRDAFNQGKRAVDAGYLDQVVERSLLEQRAYQRRAILGARRLRTLFHFPGGSAPLVSYLPDVAAPHLPVYPRFKARLIARVHLPVDRHETSALALEALALARLVPPPGRLS